MTVSMTLPAPPSVTTTFSLEHGGRSPGSQIRATVTVMHAQQKTSGVEAVFTPTYDIDGEKRSACVADVIVLYS